MSLSKFSRSPLPLSHIHRLADHHFRQSTGQFWIEGIRHFVQACDAGLQFDTIVLSPILLQNDLADMMARRLRVSGVPCLRVSPEVFRTLSKTERASGIGAVVRQPWKQLAEVDVSRGLGVLVAESLRNPGNLGTILRTAEAVGITAAIFVGSRCDPFDPAVVRASMGAVAHLPLVRTNFGDLARWLKARDVRLIGLSPDAPRLWTDLPPDQRIALAIGDERAGLSPAMRQICRDHISLPMRGRADSLNVGVAAGVMMYELVRRATTQVHRMLQNSLESSGKTR